MSDKSMGLWPTPRSTDWKGGNNKLGRTTEAQARKAGWNLQEAVSVRRRMWPTPNVPNGGRKQKGGTMSATGMTPDGKKRQVGLENAVTMTFAAPASPQLTLFAEAFPASPTPWLADAAALPTSATSGRTSPDSFASVNPDGSWRKTCQGYSQVTLDGSLERFSETWPRAGMTRSGTAYRLPPSAPLTGATESGWWPTPRETMWHGGDILAQIHGTPSAFQRFPRGAATMWPTPCAEDAKNVPYQKGKDGMTRYPMLLGAVAPERMWPTPTSITASGGAAMCKWGGSGARAKLRSMTTSQELNGALNPTWVEWLMGYPLGWTVCEAWETASSRRSRNGWRTASATPKADE